MATNFTGTSSPCEKHHHPKTATACRIMGMRRGVWRFPVHIRHGGRIYKAERSCCHGLWKGYSTDNRPRWQHPHGASAANNFCFTPSHVRRLPTGGLLILTQSMDPLKHGKLLKAKQRQPPSVGMEIKFSFKSKEGPLSSVSWKVLR